MSDGAAVGKGRGRWIALAVLLVVAVLVLRALGPGDSGPEGGWVRGKVLFADGSPAPGASVEAIFTVEGTNVTKVLHGGPTGADGVFTLPAAPPKWKGLHVTFAKWPLGSEMDLGAGPPPEEASRGLDLSLRLPKAFTVGGSVSTAEMGQFLPGMDVRFGERWTRTNSLGRFAFRDLPISMLEKPLPPLEISGSGRKPLTRELAGGGERLDDLTLRVEKGP